ncbi:MAG: hypothetical protein LBR70_06615 [Lactobacillaceae bacterium]|jgi:hypothetical protein|nr:hypothetical protein [Lactobacillaceae bacterium]
MSKNPVVKIKKEISEINKKIESARKQTFAGRTEKIRAFCGVYKIIKKCEAKKSYLEICQKISKPKWNKKNLSRSVVDMVFYSENASDKEKRFNQRVTRLMVNLLNADVESKNAFEYMKKNKLKNLYGKNAEQKPDFKPRFEPKVKGKFQNILLREGTELYLVSNKKRKKAIELFNKYQTNIDIDLIAYDDRKDVENGRYKVIETLINPTLAKKIKELINDK